MIYDETCALGYRSNKSKAFNVADYFLFLIYMDDIPFITQAQYG